MFTKNSIDPDTNLGDPAKRKGNSPSFRVSNSNNELPKYLFLDSEADVEPTSSPSNQFYHSNTSAVEYNKGSSERIQATLPYAQQFDKALIQLNSSPTNEYKFKNKNKNFKKTTKRKLTKSHLDRKREFYVIGHVIVSNEIYFQFHNGLSIDQSYLEPISSIKDVSLITQYLHSLSEDSKKLFGQQLKAYYGIGYSRKRSHLFLDEPPESLTDQLWNHKVRKKSLKKLCSDASAPNSGKEISRRSMQPDLSRNEPAIDSFFTSKKRADDNRDTILSAPSTSKGIVADIFNSIVGLNPKLDLIINSANMDNKLKLGNNSPKFGASKNSIVSHDYQVPSAFKLLSLITNKFIIRPTIPKSLPAPISDNLRLFQSLVKNFRGPPISVVNIVDDTPPPLDFEFINESRYAVDVPRPQQLLVQPCLCRTADQSNNNSLDFIPNFSRSSALSQSHTNLDNCAKTSSIFSGYSKNSFKKIYNLGCKPCLSKNGEVSHMCSHDPDTECPYNSSGLLQLPEKNAIYECNWMCPCGPKCYNRLIQRGPQILLQIFKTVNKGWGVRTLQTLQRGQFVAEYVGEIITYAEAEQRGKHNDKLGSTYLFDLDFETPEDVNAEFTIDAEKCGNITHFFNHSCSPNLQIRAAYINHCDSRLHQLVFFTKDRIPAGTELTFDYNPSAPFPGDKGYIDINETTTPGVGFSSFRSPNRSSRPGPNIMATNSNKNVDSTSPEIREYDDVANASLNSPAKASNNYSISNLPAAKSSNFDSEPWESSSIPAVTPKRQTGSLAPYIHKGYKCYCGAPKCRGFVFLS